MPFSALYLYVTYSGIPREKQLQDKPIIALKKLRQMQAQKQSLFPTENLDGRKYASSFLQNSSFSQFRIKAVLYVWSHSSFSITEQVAMNNSAGFCKLCRKMGLHTRS